MSGLEGTQRLGRAYVLRPGQRFGELTVVGFSHTTRRGNWWRFQCSCGRHVLKTASALKAALKRSGTWGGCRRCADSLYRGRVAESRESRRQTYTQRVLDGLTLYSDEALEHLASDIRSEIARALDVDPPEEECPAVPLVVYPERWEVSLTMPSRVTCALQGCRKSPVIGSRWCSAACEQESRAAEKDFRASPEYAALFRELPQSEVLP